MSSCQVSLEYRLRYNCRPINDWLESREEGESESLKKIYNFICQELTDRWYGYLKIDSGSLDITAEEVFQWAFVLFFELAQDPQDDTLDMVLKRLGVEIGYFDYNDRQPIEVDENCLIIFSIVYHLLCNQNTTLHLIDVDSESWFCDESERLKVAERIKNRYLHIDYYIRCFEAWVPEWKDMQLTYDFYNDDFDPTDPCYLTDVTAEEISELTKGFLHEEIRKLVDLYFDDSDKLKILEIIHDRFKNQIKPTRVITDSDHKFFEELREEIAGSKKSKDDNKQNCVTNEISLLDNTDSIFIEKLPNGRSISLTKLKAFIERNFIPYIENKHNWVALWQLFKCKGILGYGKKTCNSFVDMMNKEGWFKDCKFNCTIDSMRYYSKVDNEEDFDSWDKILIDNKSKKINKKGLNEIKKIYKQLLEEYSEDLICK